MKYVNLTGSPQMVRTAVMGGGTCLQFPGLDIVLEMINTVLDLRQDLAAKDRRRVLQKLIEGLLQRINAIALR